MLRDNEMNNVGEVKDDLVFEFDTREPQLEEIEYPAKIADVKVQRNINTKYGIGHKATIQFNVFVEEFDGRLIEVPLKTTYYISQSKTSRFGRMYETLTGEKVSRKISLRKLLNKKCVIKISHYTADTGDVYDNIESIRGLKDEIDLTQGIV